jgi:hypothetical protein
MPLLLLPGPDIYFDNTWENLVEVRSVDVFLYMILWSVYINLYWWLITSTEILLYYCIRSALLIFYTVSYLRWRAMLQVEILLFDFVQFTINVPFLLLIHWNQRLGNFWRDVKMSLLNIIRPMQALLH